MCNQNKPWHEGCQLVFSPQLRAILYLSACCAASSTHPHPHIHVYNSGIPHLVCHSPPPPSPPPPPPPPKRPNLGHKLPVFLIRAVKTTNWGKGSFSLNQNSHCITVLTLDSKYDQRDWIIMCSLSWSAGIIIQTVCRKTKKLCSSTHNVTAALTHSLLSRKVHLRRVLECVNRYVFMWMPVLLSP